MLLDSSDDIMHQTALTRELGLPTAAPVVKAKKRGLNKLLWLRRALVTAKRRFYFDKLGMDIHPSAEFSLSARFDKTYAPGVHLGSKSYVAFDAVILAHDRTRGLYLHTRIGENCFIGARSLLMPGISIGDGSIVGAGSVVTKDVPPGSMVAGNPARIIASGIEVGEFGRMISADATESRLVQSGLV